MRTSIATVSISGNLEGKLRAIARARFDGVEIFENDLLTSISSAREVAALMGDLGLECTLFQPFRDFEGMPDQLRPRIFERMERKFDVMQELGAKLLLICSNVSPAALADRARIVNDFRELGDRAVKRKLRVGFEALAWGRHVCDHREAWSIVKEVDHPAVGLILDSFHSLARQIPVASLLEIDPAKVFIVQVADAPLVQMDYLSWSRHLRNMPGQGELPIVDFVAALVERGYDGYLSLEIFNDRFRSTSASTVAVDGHRSLTFLYDSVARRLAPTLTPEIPPRARVRGVEFVEFAANEEETPKLEELFSHLGFTAVGRHRNKDVTRWRQNGINFVLNSEPDSFARAHDSLHGASVCALGLSVENLASAMRRADGLQMDRFFQPPGPQELDIPSLHAVGGSLLYFMEAGDESHIWEAEFENVAGHARDGGAGLLRIDHIAQTMQHEEMLSWLLYYYALFEVAKAPLVEIADPVGLVESQSLHSADGGLRLTLNSSSAIETLSSRFLRGYHGAGVQHIALATADIQHTAARLKELGLETLPIPRNYYEDLEARFGLDPGLTKTMADLNVLYDRDTDGEYFQLFSRAFAKRFFFEFVERRDYRGYGVGNAPVRLAAQSRYRDDLER